MGELSEWNNRLMTAYCHMEAPAHIVSLLSSLPVLPMLLCFIDRNGVMVGGGGRTWVKWSANTPTSHWEGHCVPCSSWPDCASLWRRMSECSEAGRSPLLIQESAAFDGWSLEQYASAHIWAYCTMAAYDCRALDIAVYFQHVDGPHCSCLAVT